MVPHIPYVVCLGLNCIPEPLGKEKVSFFGRDIDILVVSLENDSTVYTFSAMAQHIYLISCRQEMMN